MILDPVNSVTSISFYRKVAKQPLGRAFLYLFYVSLLFSLAATAALKVRLGPALNETFDWLAQAAPPLVFSDGKATSSLTAPLTLRHPSMKEIAVTIDTARTEPITPQLMDASGVIAYLTANSFYLKQQNGGIEVYDLAKTASAKPITLDAAFYRNAGRLLSRILYPLSFVVMFFVFAAWKGCAALVYSLLALLANSTLDARLEYGPLFCVSVYAQTLVIVVQAIFLFMPVGIPFFGAISVLLTGAYIWLGVRANLEPAPAA